MELVSSRKNCYQRKKVETQMYFLRLLSRQNFEILVTLKKPKIKNIILKTRTLSFSTTYFIDYLDSSDWQSKTETSPVDATHASEPSNVTEAVKSARKIIVVFSPPIEFSVY